MQDSLPAGGLRLYREGVEPSGPLRKVSGYIPILLSRTFPVARVVYAKHPFAGPEAVLAYLARYTHRVAISSSRLVGLDERSVTFRYKDYRRQGPERQKRMRLDAAEFIRRFLIHVLPKGFHRIRHFGLFANTHRAPNLAKLRTLLEPQPAPPAIEAANDNAATKDAFPCPCCGGRMRLIEVFERGAQPRLAPAFTARGIDSS